MTHFNFGILYSNHEHHNILSKLESYKENMSHIIMGVILYRSHEHHNNLSNLESYKVNMIHIQIQSKTMLQVISHCYFSNFVDTLCIRCKFKS